MLEQIRDRTGKPQPDLDVPPLPSSCLHVWNWFCQLDGSRQSGMAPNPISYQEILAFFTLFDVFPEEWEVQLIKDFDSEAMKHYAKQMKADEPKKSSKTK